MAFSKSIQSLNVNDILSKVSEAQILSFYLGVTNIPCVIHSPLRKDSRPSFGLYSKDGIKINYTDLATKESGGTFDLLSQLWGTTLNETLNKINAELVFPTNVSIKVTKPCTIQTTTNHNNNTEVQCKVREWRDYDIEYWNSFGISKEILEYADVYPVSHKIIIKEGKKYVFAADKYAYAFVEHKEGKVSIKLYQPFNKNGFKWCNKHDSSVIGLWTKVPKTGDKLCICSSVKDALCLWTNIGIPSICIQGEGYLISKTAINELNKRFKRIYILLDNDEVGILDGLKLAKHTGFDNIVLPKFSSGKDIAEYYQAYGKEGMIKNLLPLFN